MRDTARPVPPAVASAIAELDARRAAWFGVEPFLYDVAAVAAELTGHGVCCG